MTSLEWGGGLVGLTGSCVLDVRLLSGGVTVITSVCWGTSAQKQWDPCQAFLFSSTPSSCKATLAHTQHDPCGWHHMAQHSSRCKGALPLFLPCSFPCISSQVSFSLLSLLPGRPRPRRNVRSDGGRPPRAPQQRAEHRNTISSSSAVHHHHRSGQPPAVGRRRAHAQSRLFSRKQPC